MKQLHLPKKILTNFKSSQFSKIMTIITIMTFKH